MRTINVTGGFSDYAVGTLTEANGEDLTTATIKVALVLRGATLPIAASAAWKVPDVLDVVTSTATVSLLVTNTTTPGDYHLWADIVDNPTVVPVKGTGPDATVRVI